MNKCFLLSSALALLVAVPAEASPSLSANDVLVALAHGSAADPGGALVTATDLGLFEALGLGATADVATDGRLAQNVSELEAFKTTIALLQSDAASLDTSLGSSTDAVNVTTLDVTLGTAQATILRCAEQLEAAATAPGSDDTDSALTEYAAELAGTSADTTSDCSAVLGSFTTIHGIIVGSDGIYPALARALKGDGVGFERLASHFVQYALTEREAIRLVQSGYSALGDASDLASAFSAPPDDFLDRLREQEVALLDAADLYVTTGQPGTYAVAAGGLADAIVARLEGVRTEVSTYSLSILDNAQPFTPTVLDSGQSSVPLTDHVGDASATYYDTPDAQLFAGIPACGSPTQTDGFAYVRPAAGPRSGFKLGSSCTVHVERHLAQNVAAPDPTAPSWTVTARDGSTQNLAFTTLDAATLAPQTTAEDFALEGAPNGEGSGTSALTLVPDANDPTLVALAVDLPGQPGTLVRLGAAHPFAASGANDVAVFSRVALTPDAPDRYALELNGQYLSVDENGFAALADTPVAFDFRQTPDGHTELDYDGGVLYVNTQTQQAFFGEAPDIGLANAVNIASPALTMGWTVPTDFANRPQPVGSLNLYPNCFSPTTGLVSTLGADSTECSNYDLYYNEFVASFFNDDSSPRSFQFTLGGTATWLSASSAQSGGLHCYVPYSGSPDDHFDINDVAVNAAAPVKTVAPFTFDPANRSLTIPSYGTFQIYCQVLDWGSDPSGLVLDDFTVQPCRTVTDNVCQVYQ